MAKMKQALDQIHAFLGDRLSLEALEDWSASYIHSVYRVGNNKEQQLAHLVRSILDAFEDDANENALRLELATAILPFSKELAAAKPIEVVVGMPRYRALSTGSEMQMEVAV